MRGRSHYLLAVVHAQSTFEARAAVKVSIDPCVQGPAPAFPSGTAEAEGTRLDPADEGSPLKVRGILSRSMFCTTSDLVILDSCETAGILVVVSGTKTSCSMESAFQPCNACYVVDALASFAGRFETDLEVTKAVCDRQCASSP